MKTILVNRQTRPATFQKCRNFGQLISAIEAEGESENLFVVKIYLNDRLMDQDEENLLDSLSINEIETLRFEMGTISEIVGRSIANTIAEIQDIQVRAIRFSREFRRAKSVDDEKVKYLMIRCRSIIEALEEIFCSHTSGRFHIRHHSLWLESEKELTNILQVILQSRRYSEVSFLSDVIEYDLVHALDCWEEALERELLENTLLGGTFCLNNRIEKSNNGVDA